MNVLFLVFLVGFASANSLDIHGKHRYFNRHLSGLGNRAFNTIWDDKKLINKHNQPYQREYFVDEESGFPVKLVEEFHKVGLLTDALEEAEPITIAVTREQPEQVVFDHLFGNQPDGNQLMKNEFTNQLIGDNLQNGYFGDEVLTNKLVNSNLLNDYTKETANNQLINERLFRNHLVNRIFRDDIQDTQNEEFQHAGDDFLTNQIIKNYLVNQFLTEKHIQNPSVNGQTLFTVRIPLTHWKKRIFGSNGFLTDQQLYQRQQQQQLQLRKWNEQQQNWRLMQNQGHIVEDGFFVNQL